MTEQTRYPLAWPAGWRRTAVRQKAKFIGKAGKWVDGESGRQYMPRELLTIGQGIRRLVQQLEALDGRKVIISTNLILRQDGLPYATQAQPKDPGVAVYWRTRMEEARCIAIDRYDRIADNLAAVAATLEAMRAIDRHGGAAIMERAFTGFKALAAPEQWWTILGCKQDANRREIDRAFRVKASEAHPDTGGTHDAMAKLNWARETGLAGFE